MGFGPGDACARLGATSPMEKSSPPLSREAAVTPTPVPMNRRLDILDIS
jgi:hypothetical protein